jgi:hypothetical protein
VLVESIYNQMNRLGPSSIIEGVNDQPYIYIYKLFYFQLSCMYFVFLHSLWLGWKKINKITYYYLQFEPLISSLIKKFQKIVEFEK